MTRERIPLLIDTDPGVDDALALLMAFADARHDVVGLTIAAGNVGLSHTVRNALALREMLGRDDVPVFAGCPGPLVLPAVDAAHVHGRDGFGESSLPAPTGSAEDEHAALAILRLSHVHAGRLLLVALGPLTNLALAVRLDPRLPERVARLVVMGGAVHGHGNITPAAEFNIAYDPEAAHIVLSSFPRYELADWEATLAHGLAHAEVERWLAADDPRARFYERISRLTRKHSEDSRGDVWYAADALAMALALQPEHVERMQARPLQVELDGRLSRGATVVDWERRSGQADAAHILLGYRQSAFEAQVAAALGARVGR